MIAKRKKSGRSVRLWIGAGRGCTNRISDVPFAGGRTSHSPGLAGDRQRMGAVMDIDDFFRDDSESDDTPLLPVSDLQSEAAMEGLLEDLKVRMVMRIEGCTRRAAEKIVEERRRK